MGGDGFMSRWVTKWAWGFVAVWAGVAHGAVDLEWRWEAPIAELGDVIDVGLFAVAHEGIDEEIAAMDVVVEWDPQALELLDVVNDGPANWLMFGLVPDAALDGLNNSLEDGDALFTALGSFFDPATATPDGLHVATFRFHAIDDTDAALVAAVPDSGARSVTRVFGTEEVNQNITGTLGASTVEILFVPNLSVGDMRLIAGAFADVVACGEIAGEGTFGVSVMLEIVAHDDAVGEIAFTTAPPWDIVQVGDPWPARGLFTAYDTDLTGSPYLNGSVDENGTFLPTPVTYDGALTRCPIAVSADARGQFDVVLATSVGTSGWETLDTTLFAGTIDVRAPFDATGDDRVDLLDYARLTTCYTGPVGPADPPVYDADASLWCRAFDMDGDGDIDAVDFASFESQWTGPQP